MSFRSPRPRSPRRGVTLVEMLVAVALLVLMMTVIVTIFKAATGAVTSLRHYQELDGNLRQLDAIIRQDLNGVTARMTPPLDPKNNLGYFEYIENQFADVQGEDTDDCIRFTAKAPEGQLFTGRVWIGTPYTDTLPPTIGTIPRTAQPVVVSSQYAEIIYFLRNGNLYRRVLLIAPERQSTIVNVAGTTFPPDLLANTLVSWQGVNDLSARPTSSGFSNAVSSPIVLNSLGDLTNRENRAFLPRFSNDFAMNGSNSASGTAGAPGDGIADDENAYVNGGTTTITGDGVPDYYPTLYPNLFAAGATNPGLVFESNTSTSHSPTRNVSYDIMPFPYIFPGAYSQPDGFTGAYSGYGWIHSPNPIANFNTSFYSNLLAQLNNLNHAPLLGGDNVQTPNDLPAANQTQDYQTYWGFPTWRETLSVNWTDPGVPVAAGLTQPNFLHPLDPTQAPATSATGLDFLLPPMTTWGRVAEQPFNDGVGSPALANSANLTNPPGAPWTYAWEDDLVMVGVRSFDVKAYDNAFPGYVDLGWGDDVRLYQQYAYSPYSPPASYTAPTAGPFLSGTAATITWPPVPGVSTYATIGQTLAHEGRMPPLTADFRLDANFISTFAGFSWTGNVGDDYKGVIRLRRVWDTWSTEYTRAPALGFDPTTKLPVGPPFGPPIYPSYPPPYPAPMRGLQIQIRVVDPRNEQVKTLTIRQDFSDKL